MIYLDYNATTPVEVDVQKTITAALREAWGNPSCSYDAGKHAKCVIEDARRKVSEMIGSAPQEIIFTSGGTESNQMVISTAIKHFHVETQNSENMDPRYKKPHIVTTNIEHDSVRLPLEKLVEEGNAEVTFVPVCTMTGMVLVKSIMKAIKPNTCLVTVMLANNETGVIQPVPVLKSKLKEYKESLCTVLVHTDAAQALGKIGVDVDSLDVDYLTIVGHKFYGPRIGALYVKHLKPLYPIFCGGGQECNFRPGTENTPMIAGLGKAADLVTLNLEKYTQHMTEMTTYLMKVLRKCFRPNSIRLNFKDNTLPNTLSVAFNFDNVTGAALLAKAKVVCASTGSACHSGGSGPSAVLINSGVSEDWAKRTIRLSVGRETTKEECNKAVKWLHNAVRRLAFPFKQ